MTKGDNNCKNNDKSFNLDVDCRIANINSDSKTTPDEQIDMAAVWLMENTKEVTDTTHERYNDYEANAHDISTMDKLENFENDNNLETEFDGINNNLQSNQRITWTHTMVQGQGQTIP